LPAIAALLIALALAGCGGDDDTTTTATGGAGTGGASAVPMNEEGASWKVAAIAGSALFLGV